MGRDGVLYFTNTPKDGKGVLYIREPRRILPRGASSGKEDRWMNYAEDISRAHSLPPGLVKAIIKAESDGNRLAVSPKGAQGIMQLMPQTARQLNVSDPFNPIQNIDGGVKYIKELLGTFGGNLVHAVAAYNAGPAAVKKYGGVPPYEETRLYVKRVMDYYRQYRSGE